MLKRRRRQPGEAYDSREYQQAATYHAYAKDLCESYTFDRSKYRLCVVEKRYASITRSGFAKLKEDLQFLDNALKTVLSEYRDYFRERLVEGLSIRKYAEVHQLNRGSVDHLQKKFFSALACLLKERDEGRASAACGGRYKIELIQTLSGAPVFSRRSAFLSGACQRDAISPIHIMGDKPDGSRKICQLYDSKEMFSGKVIWRKSGRTEHHTLCALSEHSGVSQNFCEKDSSVLSL